MVGIPGAVLDAVTAGTLSDLRPAGVVLFSRNLREVSQVAELMEALHSACGPSLICVDQEGGVVDRLRALFPRFPSVELLAGMGNEDVLYRYGEWTGEILCAFGFNVNFAPVADLKFHDEKNALQNRYLGRDPGLVGRLAQRYLKGLQTAPVTGCLKHFPGLGRARLDSHYELPEVMASLQELRDNDLVPYRVAASEAKMVMFSHATFPRVEGRDERELRGAQEAPPASCSPAIYKLLREELQWTGIALTDDLDMQAVHRALARDQIPLRAFDAGADLLVIGENLDFARLCRDCLAASFDDVARRNNALKRTMKLQPLPAARQVNPGRIRELAAAFAEWKRSLGLQE